jgi:hypothetical protein
VTARRPLCAPIDDCWNQSLSVELPADDDGPAGIGGFTSF